MKRLLCALMAVCMLFLMGCGQEIKTDDKDVREIVDAKGYKVAVPVQPKRIASFSLSTDEILIDMIPSERIVTLSYLADDEGISHITDKSKAVKGRIKGAPSVECILKLKPDLILMGDWWSPNSIDTIRDMGICVYVYKTPYTVEEVKDTIKEIAFVVGAESRGKEMIREYEEKIKLAQAKVKAANMTMQKKIVVLSGHGVIGTKGSLFADICKYAQVENCMEKLETGQNTIVSKEFIVQENPDIIFLPGWNGAATHIVQGKKQLLEDPCLQTVNAIKNNQLVVLNGQEMYCVSHYIADSILKIDELVYPEHFYTREGNL